MQIILWSRCSAYCQNQIVRCLIVGRKQWKTTGGEIDNWLKAYVKCIKIHVWYTRQGYLSQKSDSKKQNPDSLLLIDAQCLSQAVKNSSSLFCILSRQSPASVVSKFYHYLSKSRPNHITQDNSGELATSPLKCFSDAEKQHVTYVSAEEWFKLRYIVPSMLQLMKLRELRKLSKKSVEKGKIRI